MKQIKIIIADDHQLFRDGIKSLLSSEKEIDIIGEVSGGKELLEKLEKTKPDIVITDISMPDINGIEVTKIINQKYSEIKVLILSMYVNEEFIIEGIKAGAKGYLPKDTNHEELLKAINEIYKGNEYYSKQVSEIGFKSLINKTKQKEKTKNQTETLTEREIEIIKLVAEGYLSKEISDKLNISVRTVDNHKSNIMHKLNLKSSIDIVKYAIKNEIIKL